MPDSPPSSASAEAFSAPPEPAARFQILSLDGGGLKGLYAAAVLAKIEEKAGTRVVDHFDLIAGTSTGGLIALGLGLGLSPRSIVEFYVREGPRIFRNRLGLRNALQFFFRKFPQEPLARALRSRDAFGEKLFGDSRKRLVIPSYNLSTDKVRVFRTPHIPRLTTDLNIPAWQVGLATTAAPTYFPSCALGETQLIDGGVWANNPCLTALAEAVGAFGQPYGSIRMLSMGTTVTRHSRRRSLRRGGFVSWLRGGAITDVFMSAQSVGAVGVTGHLIGMENLMRIDADVPDGAHLLDHVTVDDLLAEAEQTALHRVPEFRKQFMSHRAAPYQPCHHKEPCHVQ
jgi:hypothetical protein